MFRVQKQEFKLESICVRILKRLNRLQLFISMLTTFMALKTEQQNGFFDAFNKRARGIKARSKIQLFIYRFSDGMKAILEKDSTGIQHYKYIEKCNIPKQLAFQI